MAASTGGSLFVHGGRVVGPDGVRSADVLVLDGVVSAVGAEVDVPEGVERIDASGRLVLPGLFDAHVHFREPGATHKEDIASGSLAAIAGGVTSFCEMPNTNPPTTSPDALADKLERAARSARADHAFFLGATNENADRLGEWEQLPGCAGVKIFMGSSTGNLLVADDETLERVMRSGRRRVAVHAEDEARLRQRYEALETGAHTTRHPEVRDVQTALKASTRILDLAEKTGRPVHLLHVSTAEEVALLRERDLGDLATAEATPNHLFLDAPRCYDMHAGRAQMNPPVRDARHRDALREALADGTIRCVGSDHAPHRPDEKEKPYPSCPSGIPGVQTTLGLLLTAVRDGWLALEDVARVTSAAPAAVYGVVGKGSLDVGADGDLVIVDPEVREPLPNAWLRSRAGWSPHEGTLLAGWPVVTVLAGRVVYRDHAPVGEAQGRPLRYAPS